MSDSWWIPSVTEVLREQGLIDTTWLTEEGRWRGSAVHRACELDDLDDLDESSVPGGILPYLEAHRKFRRDCCAHWEEIERRRTHPIRHYTGKPDRYGKINGRTAVVDLKTGAPAPATAIQLAGYAELFDSPVRRYSLELRANGSYSLREHSDVGDRSVFLGALASLQWRHRHGLYAPEPRTDEVSRGV